MPDRVTRVDRVVPIRVNPALATELSNLRPACTSCNSRRVMTDLIAENARMRQGSHLLVTTAARRNRGGYPACSSQSHAGVTSSESFLVARLVFVGPGRGYPGAALLAWVAATWWLPP